MLIPDQSGLALIRDANGSDRRSRIAFGFEGLYSFVDTCLCRTYDFFRVLFMPPVIEACQSKIDRRIVAWRDKENSE